MLSLFAAIHPGVPETRMDLNEGGVWVTNEERGLVGHLNYPARTLDAGLQVDSSEFDISQSARDVLFRDATTSSLAGVDVATASLSSSATLEFPADVAQGGDRVGVLDTESGSFWVVPAADVATAPLVKESALQVTIPEGQVVASPDGTVFAAAAASQQLVTVRPDGIGYTTEVTALSALSPTADISLTSVGDDAVLFDHSTGMLRLPNGKSVTMPTADLVLQQSGPEADDVVLADATHLYRVDLGNGEIAERLSGETATSGTPAEPAVLGECAYGAWSGSGNYVRWCANEDDSDQLQVETLQTATQPVFRVNRDVIVLNDTGDGSLWLPNEDMVMVTDWEEIESELESDADFEDSPQVSDEIADPDRDAENTPPIANPDQFGVRPGSSALLPVLMNDSDQDGDLLTASVVDQPSGAQVDVARGGTALQMEVPEGASGSLDFVYQAADGRGGTDTATVSVTVRPWELNAAPEQRRVPTVAVASGSTVEYNVAPDWVDPDGDMFFLESASAPDGVQVQYRQEGTLSITDLGSEPGVKQVRIAMSDGRDSAEGVVNLDVRAAENIAPVANGDFVSVREGETVTVAPLDNDVDPNGDSLSLVSVSPAPAGTSVTPMLELGTFEFTGSAKGSYYLTYTVTDGPASTTGVIRVDVLERETESAPVAQDDLALLPADGSTVAAVLNNDFDPGGAVLVVQSVSAPDDSPLQIALVEHHLVRITAPGGLIEPARFEYTVSNGSESTTAEVMVIPTPESDTSEPPQPEADKLRVRAGDIGSVPVLDNDRSVTGLPLRVDAHLEHDIDPAAGTPFVTGNEVRFEAGPEAGTHHVTYTVRDEADNFASARVTIEVVEMDAGANAAPQPRDLTAWGVAGEPIRIPVPLSGIDPDGDSVTLVGVQQPAAMGIVSVGAHWLEYTPSPTAAGTDTFTYLVEDRLGKQSEARVRVGVAPPSTVNQIPTAVSDTVLVRPDRTVSVDVLANDSDPDGDTLSLVPDSLEVPAEAAGLVEQRDNLVVVHTPSEETTMTIGLRVSDNRGGEAFSRLTVNVSAAAPLRAPEARDDILTQEDLGEQNGGTVRVSVLDNDTDPDGTRETLEVFSTHPDVIVDGQDLIVPVSEQRTLIVYGARDVDGLVGYAVVSVPGTEVERPRLNSALLPLSLRAGQETTVDLNQYVIVRPGRTPIITAGDTVSASDGLTVSPVAAGGSSLVIKADQDFAGQASVTFEVADGDPEHDTGAQRIRLTLPIDVLAEQNQPPVFRPSPITVAVAEPAVVANVCAMVEDPDGTDSQELTYRMGSVPAGLQASLSGCVLTVGAAEPLPHGPLGSIEMSVDDGHGEVTGAIPVSIGASNRPVIQVSEALISDARPGKTETIDLNRYTINPFPEQAMEVIGSPVITRGEGTVDTQGLNVIVTPASDFLGTMSVSYTLADATGDASRQVQGTIRLIIRDKPNPPSDVRAETIGPGTASVSFTPGDHNGAPITHFTVTSNQGVSSECTVTECMVSGLQNGTSHSFTVTATNEVGTSDPSGASASILVDVQPSQPSPPTLTPKDGAVEVAVSPAASLGSPVTHYEVTLHPGGQQQRVNAGDDMTVTFSGLNNGQSYRASVQAFNNAEKPSASSELSSGAIPFGKPHAVTKPKLEIVSVSGDTAVVKATWAYGGGNGRDVTGANISLSNGRQKTVEYPTTEATFEVSLGQAVTATITQATEFGASTAATSNSVTPYGAPNAPTAPSVSVEKPKDGNANTVTVSGGSTSGGGGLSDIGMQVYSPSAGSWVNYSGKTSLSGFDVGSPATVRVRAYAKVPTTGETVYSPEVTATSSANFYERPGTLSVQTAEGSAEVTFTFNAAAAERGMPVSRVEMRGDEKSDNAQSPLVVAGDPGDQISIELRPCYENGVCGDWVSAAGEIPWPPVDYEIGFTATTCEVDAPAPEPEPGETDVPEPEPVTEDCNRITVKYIDLEHENDRIRCYYRDPESGNTLQINGREGDNISTEWTTTHTNANDFAEYETGSNNSLWCQPR